MEALRTPLFFIYFLTKSEGIFQVSVFVDNKLSNVWKKMI